MKNLKILLAILAVTFVTSISGVFAGEYDMYKVVNQPVPGLNGKYVTPYVRVVTSELGVIHKLDMVRIERDLDVRLHNLTDANTNLYTSYKPLTNGDTIRLTSSSSNDYYTMMTAGRNNVEFSAKLHYFSDTKIIFTRWFKTSEA